MSTKRTIAFYAPLKSPNHPIPSGDREIASLMMQALKMAGYSVDLVSEVSSYQKSPSTELYGARRTDVAAEEARIRTLWDRDGSLVPEVWFTYHPYCKSPDWLGPPLAKSFGIPYVTAEACRTGQGRDEDWLKGRSAAQDAIRFANINFVLKESDWKYLATMMPNMDSATRIQPFLNVAKLPPVSNETRLFDNDAPVLLTAGMMRPGKKKKVYSFLAEALEEIRHRDWNLVVAGDGPERENVEALFGFAGPDRVRFAGSVEHERMFALMDASDLFIWPGIEEPIGLVYLEAQARGLPVVALNTAGVPLVVSDGVGGVLVSENKAVAYSAAIERLLDDPNRRAQLARGGRQYVSDNHDVSTVAEIFKSSIDRILQDNPTINRP